MSFARRLNQLRGRLNEMALPKEMLEEADKILSQLDTLRNERDYVAHGVWQPDLWDPEVASRIYKSWRNHKPYEHIAVPQERLKEIFERIDALFWRLVRFSLEMSKYPQLPLKPTPPRC